MLQKRSMLASDESALLELSAREIQTMMQRLGVPSQSEAEQADIADLLLCLEQEAHALVPAPQFVPLLCDSVH